MCLKRHGKHKTMMEQLNNITLHFGDCMDMLKNMPDKSFDLAIVDPPYFSGPERRQFYGCKVSKIGVKRLYEKSETWEVPTAEYFDELQRVSKYTLYGDATTSTIFLHQVGLYGISVTAHHHFLIARLQLQIYSQALDYFLLCGMV